jgi:sarcosine oxidase subunit beta
MSETADVVVIGGGINGVSAAYELAKHGVKNVVLLEKGHIASGPTGLSSGIVRRHYTLETLAQMARDSVAVFHNFKELIGGDAGFVRSGVVFVAPAEGAEVLRETVAMHRRIGIDERLLTPADVKELEPQAAVEDIAVGAYERDGGYADPTSTANSYAAAAEREGVTIRRGTEVTGLRVEAGRIRGVETAQGPISTGAVVNVAGPWGARIAAFAGVEIPISPSRHPVLILDRPPAWRQSTPVWGDLVRGWYFKPEGPHGLMIGCLAESDGDRDVDIEGYAVKIQHEETLRYTEPVLHRFPVMANGTATGSWAGLYDVTPDGLPVIAEIPEVKGFFCAIGFSGHGFKTAPAVGVILAELVTNGACETYDISIFRPGRFRDGGTAGSRYPFHIIG